MDTRIEWINTKTSNDNLLLKVKCHECKEPFTENDIKKGNYQFIVSYANVDCFGGKPEYNKLEKRGEKYFLSLEIIRVRHENHFS